MMRGSARSVRCRIAAAFLLCAAACVGCSGEEGPAMYPIAGTVTFAGKPIPVGDIRFEPLEGVVNRQTISVAPIQDGKYNTQVTGGPQRVSVRDLTATFDDSTQRPMFQTEYYQKADLPPIDTVTGEETFDIDVPKTHR
jgi:hypothetical protein